MDAAEEYLTSVALGVRGRSIKHLSIYLIYSSIAYSTRATCLHTASHLVQLQNIDQTKVKPCIDDASAGNKVKHKKGAKQKGRHCQQYDIQQRVRPSHRRPTQEERDGTNKRRRRGWGLSSTGRVLASGTSTPGHANLI